MKLHLKILLILTPLMIVPILIVGIIAYEQLKANSEKAVLEQMEVYLNQMNREIQTNLQTAASNIEFFSESELLRRYVTTQDEELRYAILQLPLLGLFASYSRAYPSYYEIRLLMPDGFEDARYTPTFSENREENEGNSPFFLKIKESKKTIDSFLTENPDNGQKAFCVAKKIFLETTERGVREGTTDLKGYLVITISPDFIVEQIETSNIGKRKVLIVTDKSGNILFKPAGMDIGRMLPDDLFGKLQEGVRSNSLVEAYFQTDYVFKGKEVGPDLYVFSVIPKSVLLESSESMRRTVLAILLLTIISIALFLFALLRHFIISPLNKLVEATNEIGEGNLDVTLNIPPGDEIGQLASDFNHMAKKLKESQEEIKEYGRVLQQRVEERTVSLRQRNQELTNALEDLRAAQSHLVQSEKMVFLGELVAGVAHEINTPIGVGVTSASFLVGRTTEVIDLFANNDLKKSNLEKYLSDCKHSSELILKNLHRTSSLIQSFKMVSADQTHDAIRPFDVREYIDDIILSLEPKLRQTRHSLEIICREHIRVNNNPGAFAQVITNLIMNSLAHAYEQDQQGRILIEVSNENRKVSLAYRDDGKGIPQEHMDKIFNPFFTTRRNQGGTGLGLHVVYNIVHKTLGGKIRCESDFGNGTTFYIEFPDKSTEVPST